MKSITKEWLDRMAFHAQQAVEKTFKGVIEEFALGFVKTHDLVQLYGLVQPHYAIVDDIEMLEQLDAAYTESRYPDNVAFYPMERALRWRS